MIARVTSAQVSPERLDEFARWWQDAIGGLQERTPGFHSAFLMSNRRSGRSQAVSLWESREAQEGALPEITQVLQLASEFVTFPPQIEIWEVLGQV